MDPLSLLENVRSRPWIGYIAAVALPLLASSVRTALNEVFVGPYVTFFVVVIIIALIAPRGAAILATVLSALLASRFAADSGGSVLPQTLTGAISFATFLLLSGLVISLVHALASTLVHLTQTKKELMALTHELQQCVVDRTDALRSAHNQLALETDAKAAAEEQARQSQKMETIGLLTGGIAHDFNNMLSIIVGSLELIRRRVARGDTDIAKHLDNAMDGAQRSAALTQRLLAFSRKQPLAPSVLDINERVEGMEELLQRTLGSTVVVRVVQGVDLWPVKADPCQLENALLNLAINARDAMPSGGELVIETSNAHVDNISADNARGSNGQYVVISVADTGSGMPKEVTSRAFEPFFTTKPPGEGTGLGLSQIYGFIKQSGGFLKMDSAVGRGTTIKLFLPRYLNSLGDGASGEVLPFADDDNKDAQAFRS